MLKLIPILLLISAPALTLAKSEADIVLACHQAGTKKIVDQAYNFGCFVDPKTVVSVAYDDSGDKTSSNIWYSANSYCADNAMYEIRKMVRYSVEDGKCY